MESHTAPSCVVGVRLPVLSHCLSVVYLLTATTQNGAGPGKEDDEEWSVDTSEAAVKRRMEDLSSQATNLALTSDLEKSSQDRVNMLFEFVKVDIIHTVCVVCFGVR